MTWGRGLSPYVCHCEALRDVAISSRSVIARAHSARGNLRSLCPNRIVIPIVLQKRDCFVRACALPRNDVGEGVQSYGSSKSTEKRDCFVRACALPRNDEGGLVSLCLSLRGAKRRGNLRSLGRNEGENAIIIKCIAHL